MKSDDVNRMVEVMTANRMRERTRQLAEQAGFVLWYGAARKYRSGQIAVDWANNYDDELEKFAELVRQDEREACAMECIKLANKWTRLGAWGENNEFHECADSIRARGGET